MKLHLCLLHTQGGSGPQYIDIFLIIIFARRHFAWMEQDLNFRSIIKSQPKRQQGNVTEHQFHCYFFYKYLPSELNSCPTEDKNKMSIHY